jgi:hypothetical protein
MRLRHLLPLLLSGATLLLAADVSNMSGTWSLNTKRSRWADKMTPPNTVTLLIVHNDPAFKYSGTVNQSGEDTPKKFEFDGAIDGKEYAVKEDNTERRIAWKRRDERIIESTSTLPDNGGKERTTITMSRDGRALERRLEVTSSSGRKVEWVEVYEKKQ